MSSQKFEAPEVRYTLVVFMGIEKHLKKRYTLVVFMGIEKH